MRLQYTEKWMVWQGYVWLFDDICCGRPYRDESLRYRCNLLKILPIHGIVMRNAIVRSNISEGNKPFSSFLILVLLSHHRMLIFSHFKFHFFPHLFILKFFLSIYFFNYVHFHFLFVLILICHAFFFFRQNSLFIFTNRIVDKCINYLE